MKIQTPLGCVDIQIDNISVNYNYTELKADKRWIVDGIYRIQVPNPMDNQAHTIACRINIPSTAEISSSSGECLETIRFNCGNIQVDIGIEAEEGYNDNNYDYGGEHLKDGIAYIIKPETKTESFVFGIAWLNHYNKENENNTWFSCDPTIL